MIKILLVLLIILHISCNHRSEKKIIVASKEFTESVILGEIISQLLNKEGYEVEYQKELGGSRILWNALLRKDIDIYPEYTGTLAFEILAKDKLKSTSEIEDSLKNYPLNKTKNLGFNNSYAIALKKDLAKSLGIIKISDLKNYPDLKLGFSNEFIDRKDGWHALKERYSLPQENVSGLEHSLAYRGLKSGSIDVMDVYSTDAEIKYYDLQVLEDDKGFFPEYKCLLLYHKDLDPKIADLLKLLENSIDEKAMIKMNHLAKIKKLSEKRIANDFLNRELQYKKDEFQKITVLERFIENGKEHLYLTALSLFFAIITAIPLGVMASKSKYFGPLILSLTGIVQTIPSLALLVIMIPFFGTGTPSAIFAMFLYSLLPIVRNTSTAIQTLPHDIKESSEALGLPFFYKLFKIELPLSAKTILAGIKTSAVINVGTATLGALIGAGGYGQPILTGIRLDDFGLILQGAIPAALFAILTQYLFDLIEKVFFSKWD